MGFGARNEQKSGISVPVREFRIKTIEKNLIEPNFKYSALPEMILLIWVKNWPLNIQFSLQPAKVARNLRFLLMKRESS